MLDEIKLASIDAKCENCGNNLKYSPEDKGLKCEKCGSKKTIEFENVANKKPYDNLDDSELDAWKKLKKIVKCKSCGSTINLSKNEISINCPYCDSQNIVLKNDIKGLYPDNIINFAFGKNEASEKFTQQVKKKFMAPRSFKKAIPENSVDGFYFPAFSFDADSKSTYKGRLYKIVHVSNGKTTTTRRRYFNISGSIDVKHRNVAVESSSRLSQYELQNMLPYGFTNHTRFKPEFLFGYKVEQYDQPFKVSALEGEKLCCKEIETQILKKYSHDGVDYININPTYSDKKYAYYMLPVYTFSFEYKKKNYTAFMNGQTGKLGSGLPISKLKIAFGIILFVLAILIPILISVFLGE